MPRKTPPRSRFFPFVLCSLAWPTWDLAGVGLGVLLSTLPFLRTARADFEFHPWEEHREDNGVLSLDARFNFVTTSSNYFSSGVVYTPTGLSSVTRLEPELMSTYGLFERFSIYLRASWETVSVSETSGTANGSGSGFADQTLGFNYQLLARSSKYVFKPSLSLQAQADVPVYSNTSANQSSLPYLGDQTLDLTGGAAGRVPFLELGHGMLAALGTFGYTYRNNGFSSALPWSAYVEYRPVETDSPGIFGRLGGYGEISLNTDIYNPVSGLSNRPTVVTGGSYYANAIDPTLTHLLGLVGYHFRSGLEVYAMGATSIFGISAPVQTWLAGGATFRLGSSGTKFSEENVTALSPSQYGKSNQGFINYGLSAKILRANDRLSLVKINKGIQDGVRTGEIFDIFKVNTDGSMGPAIARGKVTDLKQDEAVLTITEYYKEVWIEEGFIAKRPIP